MNRRRYLSTLATAVGIGVAGCADSDGREVGSSVTRTGLEAVVAETRVVEAIEGEGVRSTHRTDEGEALLMAKLTVSNDAEEPRTPPWPRLNMVYLETGGSREPNLYLSEQFTAGDSTYTGWHHALMSVADGEYIMPGESATGWEAFSTATGDTDTDRAIILRVDTGDGRSTQAWELE